MSLLRPSPLKLCLALYAVVFLAILVHFYPGRTDPPEAIHFQPTPDQQVFYNAAFDPQQSRYEAIARRAAKAFHTTDRVAEFVATYHLSKAHVLDVGSGEGLLQDVVEDYTGLDISATARAKYHKPFVQADARAMPFPDGQFDALWTVFVLEHVPNPEQALREIRRVLKPGGYLYLSPAWLCSDLAPQGYAVRPYSDFGIGGKLVKASVPVQNSAAFIALYMLPFRAARLASWKLQGQPTSLHYRPIAANYDHYWMPDSDAVNSIDMFEAYLWFRSRGDECVNCPADSDLIRRADMTLIFRVKAQGKPATQSAEAGRP